MLVGLKPHPAMKESGVAWLGMLPSTWKIARNGGLFSQRNEPGFGGLPILEVSLKTGVRVRNLGGGGRKQVMADREEYKRARRGDLAYNTMRMWQGAIGMAPVDGLVSPAYVVARPLPGVEPRFFEYLFRTDAYMGEVDKFSHGIVKDRNRLYWEEFKQMPSPVPPPAEQAAIVRYLAHADRRIWRCIRAKQKLIKLLEEQKQAIIHRAVTRGLDPNVHLKTSGVDWLGEVAEHWDVMTLQRVTVSRCDGPFGSGLKSSHYTDHGVRVVRLQNIGHAEFRDSAAAFISPAHYASLGDHTVNADDVLIAGLGDERNPAGRACVAPAAIVPAMVKADCFRFRLVQGRVNVDFAALQLTATAAGASAALSTGATRQRTNLRATAARAVAIPSIKEQVAIVKWIRDETAPLLLAVEGAEREIALLREHLTRLVADVVTGKLDVRDAAASLPDESEEQEQHDAVALPAAGEDDGEAMDVEHEADDTQA
jgi:type I restriction enzyme, S subunit